jgi:hypothetical protein
LSITGIGAKNDSLSAVRADLRGNDRDARLCQHFQRDYNVAASEVRFFSGTRFAQAIEQASSAEDQGAKLSAVCSGFEELLQQNRNGDITVAG